jgi:hypothetical protein
MNVLSYVDLNEKNVSKGTSIASAIQQLSMSTGIALAAILLRYLIGVQGNSFDIQTSVFHQTFIVLGLITIFTTVIFNFLNSNDGTAASLHRVNNIIKNSSVNCEVKNES